MNAEAAGRAREGEDFAVVVIDEHGTVVVAEGSCARFFGREPGRLPGQSVADLARIDPRFEGGYRDAVAGLHRVFDRAVDGTTVRVRIDPRQGRGGAVVLTTDEALLTETRRLEEAQRLAHVGSFEWDVERDKVYWSREMYRIYGLEPGAFGGTLAAFLGLQHPEDLDKVREIVLEAYRTSGPFAYDHRIVQPGGAVRTLHTRAAVVRDQRSASVRVIGSCWDVSELAEMTGGLEHTISLLHGIIDATADGVLVVDRRGRVTAYNPQFLTLWRIPVELAERRNDDMLLAHVLHQLDDPEAFLRGVRDLYSAPERESFDMVLFKDGRVFERYSIPQRIGAEVIGRVWSFRDVTPREQMLRRALLLADATRLLTSLEVELALDGVAHVVLPQLGDACVIELSNAGEPRRFVAVSHESVRVAREIHPEVLEGRRRAYQLGTTAYLGVPLRCRGVVVGAMTFITQGTRRHTDEDIATAEELARRAGLSLENASAYRDARNALNARDEFIAIAAHELRGPLTSIHLAVQGLVRKNLPGKQTEERLLATIEREDRRLAAFVDQLLDVGQARSGQLRLTLEEVDLAEVAKAAIARMKDEIVKSGSSVDITVEGAAVGQWDRLRLEQVVTNLLSNAVKYGLGRPIEIMVHGGEGQAILTVCDHGMGIADDVRDNVFKPFERGARARRHYGGLGLGLYVVDTIVRGLGGAIQFDTQRGTGSRFTVTLPLRRRRQT
jgi:signal transduction histidine kinase